MFARRPSANWAGWSACPPAAPDFQVTRGYLEATVLELPWNKA